MLDVELVARLELLDSLDNLAQAALFAHLLGGKVGVASGAVPVSGNDFGVERNVQTKQLTQAMHNVARNPQLIANCDSLHRPNLKLPLRRHHFGIDARHLNSRIEARLIETDEKRNNQNVATSHLVVRFHKASSKNAVNSVAAIVGSLSSRIAASGPAQRALEAREQRVLLL